LLAKADHNQHVKPEFTSSKRFCDKTLLWTSCTKN